MLDATPQDQKELEDQIVTENGELMDGDVSMSSEGETKVQAELDQDAQDSAHRENAGHNEDAEGQQAQAQQQQAQEQQRQISQAGPVAFAWANYKGLRAEQKTAAKRDRAQGKDHAIGYNQINPADKSAVQALQTSLFGMSYLMLDEEDQKRKQKLAEYYEECRQNGAPISDIEKANHQCFEDKLFDGYRLDKTLTGNPIFSFRVVDPSGRHQQVFDDGKNVRACTNGDFNATTAMAMATMFWGHRGAAVKQTGGKMHVNLNVKKTLKGAMGGKTADEKRSYLIAANLHMAHKHGVDVEFSGKDIPNLKNMREQFNEIRAQKEQNPDFDDAAALEALKSNPEIAMLEQAITEYRQTLGALGENADFDLEALLKDPVTDNAFAKPELSDDVEMSSDATPDSPEPVNAATFTTTRDKDSAVDNQALGERMAELPQANFVKNEDGVPEFVSGRGRDENGHKAADVLAANNAVRADIDPDAVDTADRPEEVGMDDQDITNADRDAMYADDPDLEGTGQQDVPKTAIVEVLDDDAMDPFTTREQAEQAPKQLGNDDSGAAVFSSRRAVASEPRVSHGNVAKADPAIVEHNVKAEQTGPKPEAGQVLAASSADPSASKGTTGASITPQAPQIEGPNTDKPAPRLPQIPGR